eukprot:SAG31_NODE_1348_length_8693_cov_4.345008_7_plen_171_part_00
MDPPKYALTPAVVLKFSIPALIYMLGNNMLYLALRYLDAPTYQILGNAKIVVVAIVQRLMLKSKKTLLQWLGIGLLMLGMMVIASGKLSESSGDVAVRNPVPLVPSALGGPGIVRQRLRTMSPAFVNDTTAIVGDAQHLPRDDVRVPDRDVFSVRRRVLRVSAEKFGLLY